MSTEDIGPYAFESKVQHFAAQLQKIAGIQLCSALDLFPSPFLRHYRARMEFTLHRIDKGKLCYVMFAENQIQRFAYSDVPLACISEKMPKLLEYLQGNDLLAKKLFQINWRADLDGQVMLSLLYHRKLEASWLAAAQQLAAALGIHKIIGRSKNQVVAESPYLESILPLDKPLKMRQSDTCFSQPNAYINLEMLRWAQRNFADPDSDLLELYCGIGNFTCALAPQFRRVLATEVVRESIQLCRQNVESNDLDNVEVVRLSAAESAEALSGKRVFERLRNIRLADYRLNHLLLDPPRSGLDQKSRDFATNFAKILYISCNPKELLKDLAYWQSYGYRIHALAAFDQFPDTEHLELATVLQRPETLAKGHPKY